MATQTETVGQTRPGPMPIGESSVHDGELYARGVRIGALIGRVDYIDMLFFQVQGRYPTLDEHALMSAYLVSLCEHGVTSPSTHGARVSSSVRAPFAACAINFISAAMGPYHFGALEQAMRQIRHIAESVDDLDAFVDLELSEGRRLWGFGHRFHRSPNTEGLDPATLDDLQERTDPRVRRLIEIADELGWAGEHVRTVRRLGRILYERKRIPINIDGIGAGILLDMGFDAETALLFVIVGRLPNMARLHQEEQTQPPNRFVALAERADPGFDRTVDREQTIG